MSGSSMIDLTFLLTDLEESTALWERYPAAMQQAVSAHDAALRHAIEAQGGNVFKTGGDAFYAVFDRPGQAIDAALRMQIALQKMEWTDAAAQETFGLKIRAVVCLGAAEARDGDYFGPGINRAARLLSAGHGGQTLVSASVEPLVRDSLPSGAELKSLGRHRLKSLPQPEEIFQLLHPEISGETPPLRVLESFIHNLPTSLSRFIGREPELTEVKRLLTDSRLLTLCGTGGTGKTRLALQAAQELAAGYRHGVWFIELAPLAQDRLAEQAIARALGIRPTPNQTMTQALLDNLRHKSLLLILDNCEHLTRVCAPLAEAILQNCPHVQILATSQEPLRAAGETVLPLAPLSLPTRAGRLTPEDLIRWEATRLFVERAQAAQPSFAPTRRSAPVIVRLCQRLDGIPLAIELAAAQVRSFSVEQIVTLLDAQFRLTMRGSDTASLRHQTLQNMMEWSCGLLTEAERQLLYRLSVFAGGWTLTAAETVAADEENAPPSVGTAPIARREIAPLLASLLEKSLIAREENGLSERYRMLTTARGYCLTALDAGGMGDAMRQRHFLWCQAQAEQAAPLLTGARQEETLQVLESELDNFRAALLWRSQTENGAETGPNATLKLASNLRWLWEIRGYLSEARSYLTPLLEQMKGANTADYAEALCIAGNFACQQCEYTAARRLLEESHRLFALRGNLRGEADALGGLGDAAYGAGDYDAAQSLQSQSLELRRHVYDARGILTSLNSLGNIAWFQQDLETAQNCYEEALALAVSLNCKREIAFLLNNLGMMSSGAESAAAARGFFEQSLALQRELGDTYGMAISLTNIAQSYQAEGQSEAAQSAYLKAMHLFEDLGHLLYIAHILLELAASASAGGGHGRAVRLYGAAEALLQSIGVAADSIAASTPLEYLKIARQALGIAVFTVEKMKGRTQKLEEIIAFAEEDTDALNSSAP